MKVSDSELEQMRALRSARETLVARLGAAWLDYQGFAATVQESVARSLAAERRIGEEALAALGYDTARETLRIDHETGDVLVRNGDAWVVSNGPEAE